MQTRKLKKYQIIEAQCKDFVAEGLGLSYIDCDPDLYKPLTGFVWGVLPGERFLARVKKIRSGVFMGTLIPKSEVPETWIGQKSTTTEFTHEKWALFNSNDERKEPVCDNFVHCGGCKMMHLDYQDTLKYKQIWLQKQFDGNKLKDTPDIEIVSATDPFHYRNHVQVHINIKEERGFFAPYSYRTIAFPSSGCYLFDQKKFDNAFPQELSLARCVRSRLDELTGSVNIHSLNSKPDKNAKFTYSVDYPQSKTTKITISNDGFFQVNTRMLPKWLSIIRELIQQSQLKNNEEISSHNKSDTDKIRVLEVFSGFGFISRMISQELNLSVMGIDIAKPEVIKDVKVTRANKFRSKTNSTESAKDIVENNEDKEDDVDKEFNKNYIQMDLHAMSEENADVIEKIKNFNPDILIINPPRSGFLAPTMELFFTKILQSRIPIVYSSCNGATLARDSANLLMYGYSIKRTLLVDFFPWTSHYEVVCLFTRSD